MSFRQRLHSFGRTWHRLGKGPASRQRKKRAARDMSEIDNGAERIHGRRR